MKVVQDNLTPAQNKIEPIKGVRLENIFNYVYVWGLMKNK